MSRVNYEKIIYDNISDQITKEIAGMTYDQVVKAYIGSVFKLTFSNEKRVLMNQAVFGSSSTVIQGRLFDDSFLDDTDSPSDQDESGQDDSLKGTIYDEESLNRMIEDEKKKHLDQMVIAKDVLEQRIKTATALLNRKTHKSVGKPSRSTKLNRKPDEEIYVPLGEKTCPVCGEQLIPFSTNSRIKVEYVPATIRIIRITEETGVCPNHCCTENGNSVIETAKDPSVDPFQGSLCTASLAAGLAYEKLINGTPFYRLEKAFYDFGINLSHQNMCNYFIRSSEFYLEALYKRLFLIFREQEQVHLDATTLQCLEFCTAGRKVSTMVVGITGEYARHQIALFMFSETKEQVYVERFLGKNYSGVLMTDGAPEFKNYGGPCLKQNCMAHARQELFRAVLVRTDYKHFTDLRRKENQLYLEYRKLEKQTSPKPDQKDLDELKEQIRQAAQEADDAIASNPSLCILMDGMGEYQKLYQIERDCLNANLTPEQRGRVRQEVSLPVFERLTSVLTEIREGFPDGSKAAKAAEYFLSRKDALKLYISDGKLPIDDTRCERAVKTFVIPRKNFEFAKTQRGADALSVHMSIFETAILNHLKPEQYEEFVIRTVAEKGMSDEVIESLLPWSETLPEYLKAK